MSDPRDAETTDGPTRRSYLTTGLALVGSGVIAGCLGSDGNQSSTAVETTSVAETTTDPATATTATDAPTTNTTSATAAGTTTTTATTDPTSGPSTETNATNTNATGTTETAEATTAAGGSYTVAMAPMGEVEFERPPETVFTRLTHLAGMAFALGRGNDVTAMHAPAYYDALWNQFTPRLDGVSLDWTGLYSSWEPDKETLYELDSDIHLADPASVAALDNWNQADIETIGETVGPWFGNTFSDTHGQPPSEWEPSYQYYTLWEMFEHVARVFQEQNRYEELAAIRTDLGETIEKRLPPTAERPTAVLVGLSDIESIYAYTLDTPGFLTAHTRPLGPVGAFGEEITSGDTVDMEAMLEANPAVIFALGGMHPETSMPDIRTNLERDSVARQLPAVENDRVYAQGARYQGPIVNLFQLEMTAKQLYPDQFGPWPEYENGPYPEIPTDEQLFDRDRVADVITGNVRDE